MQTPRQLPIMFETINDRVQELNTQYKNTVSLMRKAGSNLERSIYAESAEIIGEEFFRAVAERNSFRKRY